MTKTSTILLWYILIACFFSSKLIGQTLDSPQDNKGIQWTLGLSWDQIKQKAKLENKYIFLDLYASWCGPCHAMDKNVYPNEEVGKVVNEKFISVRVQMDRTENDGDQIKKWYNDAKLIESKYNVTAFPTFLFFTPAGKPIHRAIGFKKSEEFIALINDALNPQRQYYTLLQNYKPGTIDTSELKALAISLEESGGDLAPTMAAEYLSKIPNSQIIEKDNIYLMTKFRTSKSIQDIAVKYLSSISPKEFIKEPNLTLINFFAFVPSIRDIMLNYLSSLDAETINKYLQLFYPFKKDARTKELANRYINSLSLDKVFEKNNVIFLSQFTNSSKDRGFKIFFHYPDRVNKVMGYYDAAQADIMNIIVSEEYNDYYAKAVKNGIDNIPWGSLKRKTEKKYGNYYADRIDIHVKTSLYGYFADKKNQHWSEYIDYFIKEYSKYGWDTSGVNHLFIEASLINNFVFSAIFYHSADERQIKTGLKWMEGVIRRNPVDANIVDTYANLLYKAGESKQAIQWEEKAESIAIEKKQEWVLPSLRNNLAKMKKGEPTWLKDVLN